MKLCIRSEDFEYEVDLPERLQEPLQAQLMVMEENGFRDRFSKAMLAKLREWMEHYLDPDLRPPTDKQLAFAEGLARRLGIRLPREALLYRVSCEAFLLQHANKKR